MERMNRNSNIKIYPVTESFVEDKMERGYLNVWNQGTPEFTCFKDSGADGSDPIPESIGQP
jgi:hypothetical protein